MDIAFYHDDPSSRLAPYDPQSSPGSVDSISSTDAGPICAIAAVPPAYRPGQQFGVDLAKTAILKGMNLQIQSGNTTYSSSQQLVYPTSSVVSRDSYQQSNYEQATVPSSLISTSANSLNLSLPDDGVITSSTLSAPEAVNMLKVGSSDLDQMLLQHSQGGPQMASQLFPRNLSHEQEYYARELARQKVHGGSNPDLARANDTPHHSLASGVNVLAHPHQYTSPESYYAGEHQDIPPTSIYCAPGSTVHHMGNPPHFQPGHSGLISPHNSMVNQQVKEELPQTVPVLANRPMSPIDMEQQELIKTERKRMRNRLAASKCRKRKLERISRLEEKVNSLKNQNLELSTNANLLRQQVAELKSKVMAHVNSGCQLMMSQQQVAF